MVDRPTVQWFEEKLTAMVRSAGTSRSGLGHGTAIELHRVAAALRARETLDRLIDAYVADARRAGAQWDDIGRAMGDKTKQAAQKRFGRPAPARLTG